MKHLRIDWERIQDPATVSPEQSPGTPFGADEPVFILRARDKNAPTAVMAWADWAQEDGASPELVKAARRWAQHMADWGHEHGAKVPDTPSAYLRPEFRTDNGKG